MAVHQRDASRRDQPEKHFWLNDVVVGESSIPLNISLAPVGTGPVVFAQPANPVLFLGPVPDAVLMKRPVGWQTPNGLEELAYPNFAWHALSSLVGGPAYVGQ